MDVPQINDSVLGLFIGKARPMPGDGRPTGIFKRAAEGSLRVLAEGLDGDVQADRRVHGGVEKALHQFPRSGYQTITTQFPQIAEKLRPGALGENISSEILTQSSACIGDVYAFGSARIQIAQPRTPCWKINARFECEGITEFLAKLGLVGWYYRVLEPGEVRVGDELRLLDRPGKTLTLENFNALSRAHRPAVDALFAAAQIEGLSADWSLRLRRRGQWLHHNQVDATDHGAGDQ